MSGRDRKVTRLAFVDCELRKAPLAEQWLDRFEALGEHIDGLAARRAVQVDQFVDLHAPILDGGRAT